MFVDDYTPMKRVGIEELEGCVRAFERRIDEDPDTDPTPKAWMMVGARLALHLVLVGRFRYPEDFIGVFDAKCAELYGCDSNA